MCIGESEWECHYAEEMAEIEEYYSSMRAAFGEVAVEYEQEKQKKVEDAAPVAAAQGGAEKEKQKKGEQAAAAAATVGAGAVREESPGGSCPRRSRKGKAEAVSGIKYCTLLYYKAASVDSTQPYSKAPTSNVSSMVPEDILANQTKDTRTCSVDVAN